MAGFRLGIDFGTSHTVAVLRWPDGRAKPLLFDGSPLLPSAVYLDVSGRPLVGRDALDSARMHPSQLEPNPKRRIDDGAVLLGDREVPVADLIGAVLGTVAGEARRTAGQQPAVVTLTCPAAWGTPRRRVLLAAAERAGLGEVRLVEEPVAAATYFAGILGHGMPVGSAVVVYDFGGGTFDVSLVERTGGGFRTRAVGGRDDIGGLDLDEVIIRRIGEVYGPLNPDGWRRLAESATRQERRQRRLFRDDVRNAKERLSRYPAADVHIAGLDRDAHITREEFEQLARPLLDETVRVTAEVAGHGGFARDRIAGVFLVGGASRIPLVATLVHHGLGIAPTVIEQPELVVAEGSLLVQSAVTVSRGSGPALVTAAGPGNGGDANGWPAPVSGGPAVPGSGMPGSGLPGSGMPGSGLPGSGMPGSGLPGSGMAVSGGPGVPVSGPPVSGPPVSGPPVSGPPVSGPPGSGVPVSGSPFAPISGHPVPPYPMSPNPAPEVPAPHPPAPEGPSGPVRRRSSLRWIVVATVLVAALLAGLAAKKLWFDGRSTGTPTACGLASRAEDTEKLAPGTEAAQATAPHDGWRRYSDPSGFRIDHPTGWRRFGGGVCFGNRREGRYIAVDQWLQGDADLVAYWVRKEDQVKAAGLDGYERIAIKPRPNYFDGAADWEFTFDDGGEKMHVWAIALLAPGNRGYGYLWATPHSAWGNNLPDFSILTGAFRPAR